MNMNVVISEGIVTVQPEIESINAGVSKEFKGSLVDLINQGNLFFLLDLSKVNFVDSSGLGALISIMKLLELNNGKIVLCAIKTPVLNLFKLTHVDQVFAIQPNVKEGLEFLNNLRDA